MEAVRIRSSHGSIVGAAESFAATVRATEGERRQQKLQDYGYIDQRTGAASSVYMESHPREGLMTFAELSVPFSILCIEVGGLEKLRSSHGPAALVTIQRVVTDSLHNALQPTDFLGQWMERRLLMILTDCSDREVAAVANRMRNTVKRAYDPVLRVMIVSFMKGTAQSMAVEIGRRAIPGHVRPTFQNPEKRLKEKGEAPAS